MRVALVLLGAKGGIQAYCLSRGLGDVYNRQVFSFGWTGRRRFFPKKVVFLGKTLIFDCPLYTFDAADE